jgi:hypothetical protein
VPAVGVGAVAVELPVPGPRGRGEDLRRLLEIRWRPGMAMALRRCLRPAQPGLAVFTRLGAVVLVTTVLQLVAFPVVGATIPFAIAGLAGRPARLVAIAIDRAERLFGVVVTVDRVIIDLMFALVIELVGAIEKVEQLLDGSFSLAAHPPQVFK